MRNQLHRNGRLYTVQSPVVQCTVLAICLATFHLSAGEALLQEHCADCHNEKKAKGKFKLSALGTQPTAENLDRWLDCIDLVSAEEMPPEDDSHLSVPDRKTLVAYFDDKVRDYHQQSAGSQRQSKPRRLNNREFANSVRDVLLLEDIGTHLPTANLIGDSLHHGFDTHGDTLSFSRFHLEQYIEAVRKIVDATILSGEKPETRRYQVAAESIAREQQSQNSKRPIRYGKNGKFDFLAPQLGAYFDDFKIAPETGRYRIKIRCTGVDRLVYDTKYTGFYHGDPIQLSVHLGDRVQTFELPDEKVLEIELDEWIAAGTRLKLYNPTDAFTMRGNGNFKFQYGITPDHLKENDPKRYDQLLEKIKARPRSKRANLDTWHNWTEYWTGARPRLFGAEIEGPFYGSWPPKRQVALIGEDPQIENATEILLPIAKRAWRREVSASELDKIVSLVKSKADALGTIEAFKEGIVSILVSPAFLLINKVDSKPKDRFAEKFSYFLQSTIPDQQLHKNKLDTFEAVYTEIADRIKNNQAEPFLRAFPTAWLELNDINFMSPDPAHYRFYHKKRLSEDMVAEALYFFRHAVEENLPLTEFLAADYSFINADLAAVYGITDVPQDSQLRKYVFTDGRRGGLLGMGAFLTATADSLATSPIHRAVYVMENFMGIHPTPPPPDVEIKEPDVRQAKTIKEILSAHTADENCASCHQSIDPWGYAFENFDPTGAWRDVYVVPKVIKTDADGNPLPADQSKKKRKSGRKETIPIDASAKFRGGAEYENIVDFRKTILTDANRDRFVRCFITKLLTYANGVEPTEADYVEISNILAKSAERDYRIVDTIAAVVDSPLFR